MRFLRGNLRHGRMLVLVGVGAFGPAGGVGSAWPAVGVAFTEFMALIDTGATRTCVSQNVVEQLALRRRGRAEIWNIRRPEQHFTYLFNLAIWPDVEPGESPAIYGLGDAIEGIDIGNHPYFDVLLGMDVLAGNSLRLAPNGSFELGFR